MTARLLVSAALAASILGCAQAVDRHEPPEVTAARQVLVMIKDEAVPHYRPSSAAASGYRSGADKTALERLASTLARENHARVVDDWPMPTLGVRCFVLELPTGVTSESVAIRLNADARVEWAQPMHVFRLLGHNDPYLPLQTMAQRLHLEDLHRLATGRGVRIAQIDSGVDLEHPDLEGQIADAKNFVDGVAYKAEAHGTQVAGVIVARADNNVGIVGVAPHAKLLVLRACWEASGTPGALCNSLTLALALQSALRLDARVLNLSLAGPQDPLLERLVDRAEARGMTIVAAVDTAFEQDPFPASHRAVIPVAARGGRDLPPRTLLAPAEQVLTTTPRNSWGFVSGSSFAAAQVSGVVALLLERSPRLKPQELRALLADNADSLAPEGLPILNACAALAHVTDLRDCPCCSASAGGAPHRVGPGRS